MHWEGVSREEDSTKKEGERSLDRMAVRGEQNLVADPIFKTWSGIQFFGLAKAWYVFDLV